MRFWPGIAKTAERADTGAAIRLGETARFVREDHSSHAWGMFLVVFMRLLAVLWVFQGLLQWSAVLLPRESLFNNVTPLWGAAVIFFAVLDLVAAVGLWLATPWGGVIWLLGAMAQIVAAVAIPGLFSMIWIAANVVLIVIYLALTWQAGRSGAPYGAPKEA